MTKLVISSTGEAAEKWNDHLGQFEYAGEHNGAPYYVQTHHDDDEGIQYLYRDAQTAWRVALDGFCIFYHPPTEDTPPLTGWQWCDGDGQHHDDPSLVLTPGPLSPPLTITLQAEGELATLFPHHLGTFSKTDQWRYGRPVYRNQEGKLLYYWGRRWSVGDTSDGGGGDIECPMSAGLWPPQAAEWWYSGGGASRYAVITVTTSNQ